MIKQQLQNALRQRYPQVIVLIVIFAAATVIITLSETPVSFTNALNNALVFFGIVISIVGVIYPNQLLKIIFILLGLCIFGVSMYFILTTKPMISPFLTIILLFNLVISIFVSWRGSKTAKENLTAVENQLQTTKDDLKNLMNKYRYKTKLSDFAASVLTPLSILVSEDGSNKDASGKRQRFVDNLLSTATKIFPEVYGASIFRRDPADRDYLKITESYNVPEQNRKRARCYVGDKKQKRGVAGEVFRNQSALVARFSRDPNDDTWKCDQDSYIPFELGTHPPFKSFACVPIVANEITDPKEPLLGVVSFDSLSESTFDSPEVVDTLTAVALYLAVILVILDTYDDKVKNEKKDGE